jgi:site-specific recombinase XerD
VVGTLATSQTRRILVRTAPPTVPKLYAPSVRAARRFIEYFAANIRNPNTRRAYLRAVVEFADWCSTRNLTDIVDIEPLHVAAYIEVIAMRLSRPSTKQQLAALRMLFDWLVVGQVIATNPAAPVRGPRHTVHKGKTPVLSQEEARTLLDSIPGDSVIGIRDRALIGTMIYTFGRVGAVIAMRVEDYYSQGRRGWVRLHEKGGKRHDLPCNQQLEQLLDAYVAAAGIGERRKEFLFRSVRGRSGALSSKPLAQADVYRMVRRRALAAGIKTRIGNHTFRATGITQYLRNGGRRELAQQMASHESPRTTALYDRRDDEVAICEVERIVI